MERVSSCSCSMTMPRSLAGSDRRRKRPRCPPPDPVKRDAVDAKSNIRSGNVPALGPADYVLLRVLRHHEDRPEDDHDEDRQQDEDRKSTRLNSSHLVISYAVFCLKKKQ